MVAMMGKSCFAYTLVKKIYKNLYSEPPVAIADLTFPWSKKTLVLHHHVLPRLDFYTNPAVPLLQFPFRPCAYIRPRSFFFLYHSIPGPALASHNALSSDPFPSFFIQKFPPFPSSLLLIICYTLTHHCPHYPTVPTVPFPLYSGHNSFSFP